jgi:adenylate kinase family enzyme
LSPEIVALCGPSRSGKSTLARHLAEKTGAAFISFGEFVRSEFAQSAPGVLPTRRELQDFGQSLVSSDPKGFLERALSAQPAPPRAVLVLDGLRHVRLLVLLREQYPESKIRVIFVEAGLHERAQRSYPITVEELSRSDSHEVEDDASRLRNQADLVVPTEVGQAQSLELLDSWAKFVGLLGS